jgi:hypothetical protein
VAGVVAGRQYGGEAAGVVGRKGESMKRFTETDKWRDTWFRKLKPLSKLAFIYIVDNCDSAGVWDPDFDLADFTIGEKVNWVDVLTDFGDRVEVLKNGKWHLVRFVEFQYGELVEECRPHAKILALLRSHGIPYGIGYPKGSHTLEERKGKEEGKGKDKDKEGCGEESGGGFLVTAESIYAEYPRKEARGDALRAIAKAMRTCAPIRLLALTKAYAEAVSSWAQEDRKFIPHPATWFNRGSYDDDPAEWQRGRHSQTPLMR